MRAEIQYAVLNPISIVVINNNEKSRVTLNFANSQHNNQTNLKSFYSLSIIFSAKPSKFNTTYIKINTVSAAFIILK